MATATERRDAFAVPTAFAGRTAYETALAEPKRAASAGHAPAPAFNSSKTSYSKQRKKRGTNYAPPSGRLFPSTQKSAGHTNNPFPH